ncbi:MAG TPA: TonB-dependent siderophore receptor [Caulobacteraceae bacterium]|nr:TonB-dependent siderophore receptor [Caulobacteraceae bacterium]
MTGEKAPRSLRPLALNAGGVGLVLAATLGGVPAAAQPIVTARPSTAVDGVTVTRGRPNLPDYVDPAAPYKVDRSASSKLTQPLLDTPKSISVITEDLYDDLGATNFRDLMRTQPGVTLGTGEGGNAYGDRIFIRGFEARNDVYIDGVRDPGVGAREIFDIDQVEILKGPSSAIAGRGTTGGAVSLISKQPLMRAFGDLEATYGDDGTRRVTLDLNRPLTDRLTVRFNGLYHEGGVAGRNAVFNDRQGWAGAVSWRPIDTVKLGFDYYHVSTNEMPDFGVPYDLANNRPFQVDRNNFYGVVARDFRKTFADIYTARAQWEPSDRLRINTLLRYGQTLNAYTASAPEGPNAALGTVNANPKRRDAVTSTWASQTNAQLDFDTGPFTHTIAAGFEFSGETILNRGRAFLECATLPCTGAATAAVQNLYAPNPYVARGVVDNGVSSRTTSDVASRAVYALDTVKLGPKWELLAGLRYDHYDLQFKQLTTATGVVVTRGNVTGFWNGQLALTYKPVKNASLYAAFGTSSNPSGEQLDSTSLDYGGLDPRTASLDPERNKTYEIGAKWNVADEHLMLTAAAFRIDKTNARVALNATTVLLAGAQRVDGFELGVSGSVTPKWQMSGGFTYIDARITDSPTVAQIGAKFPNVPKVSWSVTSKYRLSQVFTVGGTVTHNSRRYGGTVSALTTSIPGFTRYDLFGTIQVTRQLAFDINLINLTDKTYYDALYRSATPFVYVAPGRALLVKADYHF